MGKSTRKEAFDIQKWSEKLENFAQKAYNEWKTSTQKDRFKEKQYTEKKINQLGLYDL